MRLKNMVLVGALGGLGLCACKDGSVSTAAAAPEGAGTGQVGLTVVEAAAAPKATPDDRAKALGYAKYLPKDTQAYFGIYDGKGFVKSILDSKLGTYVENMANEQGGVDLNEVVEDPQAGMVLSLLAEEMFVAVGPGAGTQMHNLMLLNESSNFQSMKAMVKMLDMELTGKEDEDAMMGMEAAMMPFVGGLMEDPRAGLEIFEKSQMPPLTIGVKVSDAEVREQVSGMIAGFMMELLGEIGPDGEDFAEAIEVKRGEVTFTGVKIVGKKLATKLDEEAREDMAEVFDAATIERLLKIVAEKNIVVATGVHDGYVLIFGGADEEELQIAASPAESFAASPDLAFVDGYLGKNLLSVSMISQKVMDGMMKDVSSLGSMVGGIKAGLSESEGFGDTRDLEVLLDLVATQEKELLALTKYYHAGLVVHREEGLKIEGIGGTNGAGAKLDVPHAYGSLAKRDNVLMFADWVGDEEYNEKTLTYLDTIGETVYLGAKRFSQLEIEDGDMDEFRGMFGMFEEKLRPDLLELWKAIRSDLAKGLGGETAIVVDSDGSLPTVPGMSQVIADKGKAPRIGIVKPVTDRERIGTSWKRINTSMEGILKTVSEMGELDIPMQKPMSSEKNELKTWFFASIPFQTDDFVMSVSIDEQNFYASTSKSFVEEISASLADAKPDPARVGAYMTFDFNVLRDYLGDWIKVAEENSGDFFGDDEDAAEQMQAMMPMVKETLAAFEDLDTIQAHSRMEGGKLRSSFHFKVK